MLSPKVPSKITYSGKDVTLAIDAEHNEFVLDAAPGTIDRIFLTSKYWVPAQAKSDHSVDKRLLGVAVQRLSFDDRDTPMDSDVLVDGWYGYDKSSRWTNGCASLKVGGPAPRRVTVDLDPGRNGLYKAGQVILPSDKEIALCFESIGNNCEFGMFQRRIGAEPLGFLRFAGMRLPNLIRGLDEEFNQIEDISLNVLGTEYMVKVNKYDYQYHSGSHTHQVTPEKVLADQYIKNEFQRRAFLEDLSSPYKLYVYKQNEEMSRDEVDQLLGALRRHGPCSLLWVTEQDHDRFGHVEMIADGLMRGYIDRFSPRASAGRFSLQGWLHVMRNAYAIWTGEEEQSGYRVRLPTTEPGRD